VIDKAANNGRHDSVLPQKQEMMTARAKRRNARYREGETKDFYFADMGIGSQVLF
jgi:hypothetical protein